MTLQLRAINKRFGERQVLHQLDLDVANGECVALLGASGCGKSTALRLIAGLDHPDQGSIRINGAEMVDVPAERRRVGMVFQSYALFPHLNVWDNLELGLRMRGGSAANRDERRCCSSAGKPGNGPHNCPAASASASPWPEPCCGTPSFICSMSR
jgi:multiple sugar transport system ATP-binding protein